MRVKSPSTAPHHRLATRIAVVSATAFTLLVTGWTLFSGAVTNLSLAANGREGGAASVVAARQYVVARPFDAMGWLAWVGASGQMSMRPLPAAAEAKVGAAVRLAPVDPQVIRSNALVLAARGDNRAALGRLGSLARSGGEDGAAALAAMQPMVGTPEFRDFVTQGLRDQSDIVIGLLMQACRSGTTLASLAAFAQQVISVRSIPDTVVKCIAERAIDGNEAPFAYWLWLNGSERLPSRISNVLSGDFESGSSAGPFDWTINPGGEYRDGFSARIQKSDFPGRGNVLAVRFNGRSITGPIAQQVLALAEGRHTLQYLTQASTTATAAPLIWHVGCLRGDSVLTTQARQVEPLDANWTKVTVNFVVPRDCTGQKLTLVVTGRVQAAEGGRGSVQFDDIGITRLAAQ